MKQKQNFMDRYSSPEEFIRAEVCANKGTQNVIQKDMILELLKKKNIDADSKASKAELYDQLRKIMPLDEIISHCEHLGVSSRAWQLKFGITNEQVKHMANKGYISVTSTERFRGWGKTLYAPLYNVFDYYRLSQQEVQEWLRNNPCRVRKIDRQR